jgi:hypothetical protein
MDPPREPWGRAATTSALVQRAPSSTSFARITGPLEFEAQAIGPAPIVAPWLSDVSRRIKDSIVPEGCQCENEGQWLSPSIALAATAFFQLTSDVLPSEPHIYSSLSGDLVAEFAGPRGILNAVISPRRIIALVVTGDSTIEKNIDWNSISANTLRRELGEITLMLCDEKYGSKMGA